MSLNDVYTLAHTAQCRLNIAASRPDRNLRFVVGHLMHYESLRLRIVEIEHNLSRTQHTRTLHHKSTGVSNHHSQYKPSTAPLAHGSPLNPVTGNDYSNNEDDYQDDCAYDEDGDADGLSLQRFPSGSARRPQPPPELEPHGLSDNDDDDDEFSDEEPSSPEEPDQATLENVLKGSGSDELAQMYEGVRNCPCNGAANVPRIERMWELPDNGEPKTGRVRAVAEVSVAEG